MNSKLSYEERKSLYKNYCRKLDEDVSNGNISKEYAREQKFWTMIGLSLLPKLTVQDYLTSKTKRR